MQRLLTMLCMAVVWTAIQAANKITLSGGSGHPGDEVGVSLALENSDAVSALEVHIPLGGSLTLVDGSCLLNAGRSDGHQVTAAMHADTLKIYVYSLSLKPLKGNAGELLSFRLLCGKEPATYALQPKAVMSDAAGTSIAATAESGEATVLSPKMEIVTPEIDFGRVPIRGTYTADIQLRNTGNEPLTITGMTMGDATLTVAEPQPTIVAGETRSVTLTYKPTERGTFASEISIASDAVNAAKQRIVEIKATPFSVNELHVSLASGISDTEVVITLRMNNMEPIVAMQCHLLLPDALRYVEGSATLLDRSNGHSVNAAMVGDTLRLLVHSASNAVLKGNDGDVLSFKLRLSGSSGWYYLYPQNVILANATMENMTSATTEGYVELASPSLYAENALPFGAQPLTSAITAGYVINNYGSAPLVVDNVVFLSEGFHTITALPLTIAQGSQATLQVEYDALGEGEISTTMQVYSNDPLNRMKTVSISGKVYEPNDITLSLATGADKSCRMAMNLDNYSGITALQFDIHGVLNTTLTEEDIIRSARMEGHTVVVRQMGETDYRVIVYSATNAAIKGNSGEIMTIRLKSDTETSTTITIDNLVMSTTDGKDKASTTSLSAYVTYHYDPLVMGDANGDGTVNSTDITLAINKFLGKDTNIVMEAADMNGDGVINTTDITMMVQKFLKNE